MDFTQYQQLSFSQWWKKMKDLNIESIDDYLLFNVKGQYDGPFQNAVQLLESSSTLSLTDLSNMKKAQVQMIAQSTEGDYIFSSPLETYVIPVDLHIKDIERYPMSIAPFMAQWQQGKIHSRYLKALKNS